MRGITSRVIGALAALLIASGAQSATVTLNGSTIKYEYDTVTNAAALALFGAPTIVGDTIRFLPPSFKAESIDGVGATTGTSTDQVSANFIFDRVYSTNQKPLMQIQIVEFGDYEITNGDDVSADLLFTMSNNNLLTEFTSDSQSFDATGGNTGLQTWQLVSLLSPKDEFSAVANDVAISIQNTLKATTNAAGETAWIQKKITLVASTGTIIPIPPTAWLFGSALGLLGWWRRKAA